MQRTVLENQDGGLEMTKHDPTHFVEQNMTEKWYFASNILVRCDNPTLWLAPADIGEECLTTNEKTLSPPMNRNTNECLDQSRGSPLTAIEHISRGRIETFQKQI